MKAAVILSVAAIVFATGAAAQTAANCQTSLVVYGVSHRGAAVCNHDWLARPSMRTIDAMARPCLKRSDAEALKQQGMEKFDHDLKASGKDDACAALDGLLRQME